MPTADTMGQTDRQARIAQLRAQIEKLQQELALLEKDEERGPYQEYVERARAAGQAPKPQAEVDRYIAAHAQLEQEWTRLGRPAQGWARLPVLVRLRDLLLLPALPAGGAAPATPAARATPAVAAGRSTAPAAAPPPSANGPAAPGRYTPPAISREQLVEMHNPILNEIVELNKRAVEDFKNGRVPDGVISVERAMYLLERVAHAPPAMQSGVAKIVDDAGRLTGLTENDRARLARIKERASELAKSTAGH